MIELYTGLPDHVVGARLCGPATGADFNRVVRPLLEAALARHRKASLLVTVPDGPAAESSLKQLLEGGGLGLGDLRHLDRLALVSDLDWLKRKLALFGLFAPCTIKRFGEEEAAAALTWVSQR